MKTTLMVLLTATAAAAATLTPDERSCEVGRGRAVYGMIAAEGACIRACRARPGADCGLPDGADVAPCLAKAKTSTLRTMFRASCRRDCPECWGGCGADVAAGEVTYSTGLVLAFAPIVYCDADPSPAESRCMDRVAKAAAWFAEHHGTCFTRAHARGADGGTTGDAQARTCADRAARRAAAAIAGRCGADAPTCHAGRTADEWIAFVRAAVDHGRPVIFCAE